MLLILALAASAQRPADETVTVPRRALRELCVIARYNSFLVEKAAQIGMRNGDITGFVALELPAHICESVGIDVDVDVDGGFPSMSEDVAIEGKTSVSDPVEASRVLLED